MRKYIIKSSKWYGWFWPPERKKIKIMQALIDSHAEEIEKEVKEDLRDYLIYGIKPSYMEQSNLERKE